MRAVTDRAMRTASPAARALSSLRTPWLKMTTPTAVATSAIISARRMAPK